MQRWWMLVLAAAMLTADVRAQCGPTPAAVLGGEVRFMAKLDGPRVAVVRGTSLELYDVTDAANPVRLDRVDGATQGGGLPNIRDLFAAGSLLFTLEGGGVGIYDTGSDRLLHASTYVPGGDAQSLSGIRAVPGVLYTLQPGLFEMVDVSTPSTPRVLSRTPFTNTGGFAGRGTQLYATRSSGLVGIDCSAPPTPRVVLTGLPDLTVGPGSVDGDRMWAYAAAEGRVLAYDIGHGMIPTLIGPLAPGFGAAPVTVNGVSYVGFDGRNVAADLMNPAAPVVLGDLPASVSTPFIPVSAGALVARGNGFTTVDITDPSSTSVLASSPGDFFTPLATAAEGSVLWVLDTTGEYPRLPRYRLVSFDVSDPHAPRRLASLDLPGIAYDRGLAVAGGLLATSQRMEGDTIRFFDVTDPAAPFARGSIQLPLSNAQRLAMRPGLAAALTGAGSNIALIDLTNPDAPAVVGQVPWGLSSAPGPAFDGTTLVLMNGATLSKYDTSDPHAPSLTLRFEHFLGTPSSLAAKDGVVAAATFFSFRPFVLNAGATAFSSTFVSEEARSTAFDRLATGPDGIVTAAAGVIDVSDPGHAYFREWALPPNARSAMWFGVAGLPGAVAALGVYEVWLYTTGGSHAPPIRGGFDLGTRAHRPCVGEPYELSVDAVGSDLTYQWYDRINVPIPGATSATLRFPRFTEADVRGFYCMVSNACGTTAYPLKGINYPSWYFCPADFNCDRFVDFFDYLDYLDAFEAGDLRSDINGDEFLDFFDYSEFVRRFEQGC